MATSKKRQVRGSSLTRTVENKREAIKKPNLDKAKLRSATPAQARAVANQYYGGSMDSLRNDLRTRYYGDSDEKMRKDFKKYPAPSQKKKRG